MRGRKPLEAFNAAVAEESCGSHAPFGTVLALLAGAFIYSPAVQAETVGASGDYCWSPSQLHAKDGESKAIITRRAYRSVPSREFANQSARSQQTGKVLRRVELPPGKKLVSFTFDLCEQPFEIAGYQGGIVDYLRKNKVPTTFFAGGKWLLTHSERAEQLLGDPLFEVGNHAWEHRFFPLLSRSRMRTEIEAAQLAYQQVHKGLRVRRCLGPNGKPAFQNALPQQQLFRFPFGACTPEAIKAVESKGLLAVQWDVSSSDAWRGQSRNGMIRSVLKRVRPGSIVLFHANGRGWKTAEALPILVKELRKRGYEFVQVSELIAAGRPVYAEKCYDFRVGDVKRYRPIAARLERSYDRFYKWLGKHPPQIATKAGARPGNAGSFSRKLDGEVPN